MNSTNILKIFFPQCLLNSPSGICIGKKDCATRSVCILAVIHPEERQHSINEFLEQKRTNCKLDLSVIGTYTNTTLGSASWAEPPQDIILEFEQRHHNGIPVCRVLQDPWLEHHGDFEISPLLILFDEVQIMKACGDDGTNGRKILCSAESDTPNTDVSKTATQSGSIAVPKTRESHHPCKELDMVTSVVQSFSECSHGPASRPEETQVSSIQRVPASKGVAMLRKLSELCIMIPVCIAAIPFLCLDWVRSPRLFNSSMVKKVVTYPATGAQAAIKTHQFTELVRKKFKGSEAIESDSRNRKLDFIRTGNLLSSLLVDLLLGISLLYLMYVTDAPWVLAGLIRTWADQTGLGLQRLLHWLMGAPAGLKLNTSLAHFLGNFFLYHVYLWIGYLNILLPIMASLMWCIAGAGVLGLSVQLALASDFLSLLTFHIYCFYVYAARIYSLQVSALLSLARLFQGKKWNVLRQRVDSCRYDMDQLFMGTLLFTMLLFMLPTTALFYVVFTLLRLVILTLQSLLSLVRDFLHTFSCFSLLLWLAKSDILSQGLEFRVLPSLPWQPTTLVLQMQLMPFGQALKLGRGDLNPALQEKHPLSLICKKLARGQLIYPWGGDRS